jgi:hypothetical protein
VKELSGSPQPTVPAVNRLSRRKFQFRARSCCRRASRRRRSGPITAVYPYVDEQGATLFEVCRHEPGENGKAKSFRQRVPIGNGFTYSVKGVRRVLYRLPEILAASEVWICEGEKDVHTLEVRDWSPPPTPAALNRHGFPNTPKPLQAKTS